MLLIGVASSLIGMLEKPNLDQSKGSGIKGVTGLRTRAGKSRMLGEMIGSQVYPEESFGKVKKYEVLMLLTQDECVKPFTSNLNA
ncbi:hypothetical protein LINPERPRIM_LOCUS10994 [Linum perenne]